MSDAYDRLLNQGDLYRGDLAWQAEIGEHEFPEGYGYALDLQLYERLREIRGHWDHQDGAEVPAETNE